jgi:hypothetical protein
MLVICLVQHARALRLRGASGLDEAKPMEEGQ